MTAQERAFVAGGGTPAPKDPFEELHGDSSPISGRYATWFWKFPVDQVYPDSGLSGDEAGAWMLLDVLLDERPVIKAAIEAIDAQRLASDMYHTGYYEGFHDPRLPGGAEQNIADYAHAISAAAGAFTAGLAAWTPGRPEASGSGAQDVTTVLGVQRALNLLTVADPLLDEDGVNGPKTRAAVMLFQQQSGLDVDGVVGPQTRAALAAALAKRG